MKVIEISKIYLNFRMSDCFVCRCLLTNILGGTLKGFHVIRLVRLKEGFFVVFQLNMVNKIDNKNSVTSSPSFFKADKISTFCWVMAASEVLPKVTSL